MIYVTVCTHVNVQACICKSVCVCTRARICQDRKCVLHIRWSYWSCGCEPPDTGTESQTPVFCSSLQPSRQAPDFVAFHIVLSFTFLAVQIKILALSSTLKEVYLMSTIPHSVFPSSILLGLCNYLNFPYGNRHKDNLPESRSRI